MQLPPQQGMKKLGAEVLAHHIWPACRGFEWLASLTAAKKNCPLPFPQRKAHALEPSAVFRSCTKSLEAASSHPAGTHHPRGSTGSVLGKPVPWPLVLHRQQHSADNEKSFCLATIKLLPFHERNPEFFLKPKKKVSLLFVSSLSRAATFK